MNRRGLRAGVVRTAAVLGLCGAVAGCSGGVPVADLDSALARAVDAETRLAETEGSLAGQRDLANDLRAQLESAEAELSRLDAGTTRLRDALETKVEELASLQGDLDAAIEDLATQRDSNFALLLAFDGDVRRARQDATAIALDTSCGYGTARANDGAAVASQALVGAVAQSVAAAGATDEALAALLQLDGDVGRLLMATNEELVAEAEKCYAEQAARLEAELEPARQAMLRMAVESICELGTANESSGLYGQNQYLAAAQAAIEADLELAGFLPRLGGIEGLLGIDRATDLAETPAGQEAQTCIKKALSTRPKGSGIYEIGVDIAVGTWSTEGEISDCYWARLRTDGSIIDNDFASAARRIVVRLRSSDALFESNRCGEWVFQGP